MLGEKYELVWARHLIPVFICSVATGLSCLLYYKVLNWLYQIYINILWKLHKTYEVSG